MRMLRSAVLLAVSICVHQAWGQIPPSFKDLSSLMDKQLDAFNKQINALGSGGAFPLFAPSLVHADANIGPGVIVPAYYETLYLELQQLHAMGADAVMIELPFPVLYRPFFSSDAEYQSFVAFYRRVASDVQSLGMKLIVENDTLYSSGPVAVWNPGKFYKTLNWTAYRQARAAGAVAIAQAMHPDYLVLVQEPDTESNNSGQSEVNTPAGAGALVSEMLTALRQAGVTGTRFSAGIGSWHPSFDSFAHQFAALPLDTIDIHIYPLNYSYLSNVLKIAQIAGAAGKPISMSENWPHKLRNSELGKLSQEDTRARDTYSFWSPLDSYFARTLANLAVHTHMSFLTLFESQYLWAYLDYNQVKSFSPSKILKDASKAQQTANWHAQDSATGAGVYELLLHGNDHSPPSAPSHLIGKANHAGKVSISWNASTDNVGVAGYSVLRDGVKQATLSPTFYDDKGVAAGHTYSYAVVAFDRAGNVSSPSATIHISVPADR